MFNKMMLIIVVGISLSTSVFAEDTPLSLYGKAHIATGAVDDDNGDATQMKSNSSRLGVKGSMAVENELKITYKVEWQVDLSDNSKSSDDHIKGRNQYIGVMGSFGEVRIGRHDTIYKTVTGEFDICGDTYIDYNNVLNSAQDKRADNTIAYLNSIDEFSFGLTYSLGDEDTINNGEGAVVSLGVNYKAGPLVLAGGYQDIDEGDSAIKFAASYDINEFTVGGVIESIDGNTSVADETNAFLLGKYRISDKNSLKLVYGQKDIDGADNPNMFGIGFDHKFNDKATVYVFAGSGSDNGLNASSSLVGDSTAVAAGLIVSF